MWFSLWFSLQYDSLYTQAMGGLFVELRSQVSSGVTFRVGFYTPHQVRSLIKYWCTPARSMCLNQAAPRSHIIAYVCGRCCFRRVFRHFSPKKVEQIIRALHRKLQKNFFRTAVVIDSTAGSSFLLIFLLSNCYSIINKTESAK